MNTELAPRVTTHRKPRHPNEASVDRIQQEVLEGCLWLAGDNVAHRRQIIHFLRYARYYSDGWWRQQQTRSLGWWLQQAGLPGYDAYA